MDASRFDRLVLALTDGRTRRELVRVFMATLGLGALGRPSAVTAKKKRKRPRLNAFGCVDVGKPCRGKDAKCCSGICQGKKPKKGKRDKSRCVAHNTGSCRPDEAACTGELPVLCGLTGNCFRTTGNASFCGLAGICERCAKDADCEAILGPGAACVICPLNGCGTGQETVCYSAGA